MSQAQRVEGYQLPLKHGPFRSGVKTANTANLGVSEATTSTATINGSEAM